MGNQNRKATKAEMSRARRVIRRAFPEQVFSGRGGSVSPRVRTVSFRLRDLRGQFCSNVVWLQPQWLSRLTVEDVRYLVNRSNGTKQ